MNDHKQRRIQGHFFDIALTLHLQQAGLTVIIRPESAVRKMLGAQLIKNLKPSEKPYEVQDTRLKGLLLRVQPSGAMSYYLVYGRGRRVNLGRADVITTEQARNQAKEIMAKVFAGEDPAARKSANCTLGVFLEGEYADWAKVNLKTADATLKRLKGCFDEFWETNLPKITPARFERWRTKRLEQGIKPSTVNRDTTALKACLAKAEQWGYVEKSPLEKVRKIRIDDRATVRFLTADEYNKLMQALDAREEKIRVDRDSANVWRAKRNYPLLADMRQTPFVDHLKPMVILSLYTGMRFGELTHLDWGSVDMDGPRITVHGYHSKSMKTRHIPLNAVAKDLLSSWRSMQKDTDGLVFPGRDGKPFDNVKFSWSTVLKQAGISKFRWHDMRHSFASQLVMKGVDLNTVRELLGHSDYQMTLRYAHLAPEHKAAAISKLEFGHVS